MDWDAIKKDHRVKNTEELFCIDPVPVHQCPSIDTICQAISNIESSANVSRYDKRDEEERLSDISWEIRGLERSIEEIRDAVEDVRRWGQEWKDLAKRIIEENNIDINDLI